MSFKGLLERKDIPPDVKEDIKKIILKLKDSEAKLRDSQIYYRSISNVLTDPIHIVDQDLQLLFFNKALKQRIKELGLETDIIGQNLFDAFPHLHDKIRAEYHQVFQTGKVLITEEITKLGNEEIITEVEKIPIFENGKVKRIFTYVRDITNRRRAEEKLRESEEKYRNLVERANDGIFIIQNRLMKYANPALAKITGYTIEEISNTPFEKFIHPDDLSNAVSLYNNYVAGKEVPPIFETKIRRKDGSSANIELNTGPITYQDKPAILLIIRDITDRKNAERALQESEEFFRATVESTADGILLVDETRQIIYANARFAEIWNIPKEIIQKGNSHKLLKYVKDQLEEHQTFLSRVEELYSTLEEDFDTLVFKDGRIIERYSCPLIQDGKNVGRVWSFRDITDRKQAEKKLQEVKRQEERYHTMLGHFLKNNLQKIVTNLEYLSTKAQPTWEFNMEIVKNIMDISYHSARTIDTVNKIFAVLQTPFEHHQEPLNLLDVIQEVVLELQTSLSFACPITTNQKTLDVRIFADKYLKDVFYELLFFILSPTNEGVIIKGSYLSSQLCVTIQDHCSQPIPEDVCIRLTEKITDRWESQGHFIGISLVSVIMQHYNGHLTINPSNHLGNSFQLFFPRDLIDFKEIEKSLDSDFSLF